MTKKHKKKNKEKKKKAQDTGIVLSQTPPVSTTMSSLDSVRQSMPETTDLSVTTGMLRDYLCKKIDDTAFSGPGNSLNKDDYHAWCIDDQGFVCDYTDDQLMKDVQYGTLDIVRRPFTAHAIAKWLLTCDETYDAYLQAHCAINGGDVEYAKTILAALINTPFFPPKNCYIRAKLLHESDPKKYSLVIGSLGFRQADGRIHWEYG